MTSKSVIVISALLFTTATTGTSALAEGEYGPLKMTKTTVGEVLTTPEGMTLYTFDKDKKGVSNCKGDCAKMWPPLKAKKGAKPTGNLTIVRAFPLPPTDRIRRGPSARPTASRSRPPSPDNLRERTGW
jgi:predicted lipoprotein with Yx(FWY)xxD motif